MKKFTVTALLTLAGLVSAGSAFAQIKHEVRAYIPFEFSVGNEVLPAGNYVFDSESFPTADNHVLRVRNIDHPHYAAVALGNDGSWKQMPLYKADTERLVFDTYGGQYFLREVRGQVESLNLEFPTTKAEKTAERSTVASNATQTTIVAGQ
jgi:hypothetical protein